MSNNLAFPFDDDASFAASISNLAVPVRSGHYDELRAAGSLREPYRRFFETLGSEGMDDLERRRQAAAKQIRDNGVTYNVYADANGPSRPWSLDLLPFVLDAADWQQIEHGVAQRASLLNAILADAYGPRQLLHAGLLPAALVQGHPGYLRSLAGYTPPGGVYLHIAAFDLARAPDGRWCVVSQRTQAPSGLGYALENRMIVAQQFPKAFRELRVQHLASSYRKLLDTLYSLSPAGTSPDGAPRIVLLTAGPYNETYFEHAYLARYLGLPLVEGSDLTVRDDKLYMKTLSGLEPVQAVLRRLDDDFCDPLELRPDSTLGVPGLLQAVRAGNVLVANALGSSFLESPGILAFLPGIADHLLGEPLALPSLPSWWCGEQAAMEEALLDLKRHVIKPTYPRQATQTHFEPVMCASTPTSALAGWQSRMQINPEAYTLQDYLPLSQVPTWTEQRLVPRAAMVRVFAIADGNGHWSVLPGGLTRIASRDQQIVSMQHGGSSLDTWVLTEGEVDTFSMLPGKLRPEDLANRRGVISSRAAENLFWMGRYAERAETGVRLARLVLDWLNANERLPADFIATVSQLCLRAGLVPVDAPELAANPWAFQQKLIAALGDADGATSVAFNLDALARSAAQIRDRLSPDHARLVLAPNAPFANWAERAGPESRDPTTEAMTALDQLAIDLAAISGEQADRMTRDDGWRLLTIGRHIERLAAMSSAMSAAFHSGTPHGPAFDLLLGVFDSAITYRSRYQRHEEIPALLDLLAREKDNPRSLRFVLRVLRRELGRLPTLPGVAPLTELLPLGRPDLAMLCEKDSNGYHPALIDWTLKLQRTAMQLSDAIGLRYFSHTHDVNQTFLI
ncbi:circularly permuted type 2 ATP-grasp protein [Andreprevotia chitinilytica]|uniref:circularly permuted type 2 ATP-grasp protein n=1 Tax=Andreprevotia chitinilytica TaxID=396808 RepID=UPI0005529C65|nr:circularly permuted type 2 ATP-grasp protein [Andreprevotia chitinilytica]